MAKLNGYDIRYAKRTGGKAGKGRNKTSTVQVFSGDFKIREFRFIVGSTVSRVNACIKAEHYVNSL